MSYEIQLQAWHTILIDEKLVGLAKYSREWIEIATRCSEAPDRPVSVDGCLILGHGTAHDYIFKAVEELQLEGQNIWETYDGNIFGSPEILKQAILRRWDEWHKVDDRWFWSKKTILDFFMLYEWATIIIWVY